MSVNWTLLAAGTGLFGMSVATNNAMMGTASGILIGLSVFLK